MRWPERPSRGDVYSMIEASSALTWSTNGTAAYDADGDMSNSNLYSNPIRLSMSDGYAVQLVTTTGGTIAGAFKLQFSLSNPDREDPDTGLPMNPAPASMTWTDVPDSSQTVAAAGDVGWIVDAAHYPWFRVVWTEGSATTGTVTGRAYTKGSH